MPGKKIKHFTPLYFSPVWNSEKGVMNFSKSRTWASFHYKPRRMEKKLKEQKPSTQRKKLEHKKHGVKRLLKRACSWPPGVFPLRLGCQMGAWSDKTKDISKDTGYDHEDYKFKSKHPAYKWNTKACNFSSMHARNKHPQTNATKDMQPSSLKAPLCKLNWI